MMSNFRLLMSHQSPPFEQSLPEIWIGLSIAGFRKPLERRLEWTAVGFFRPFVVSDRENCRWFQEGRFHVRGKMGISSLSWSD